MAVSHICQLYCHSTACVSTFFRSSVSNIPGDSFSAMALPSATIYRFYQNTHILKSSNGSSLTGSKRYSSTAFCYWMRDMDKPYPKHQFLNIAVCGKHKFECKHKFFDPAIIGSKRKVLVFGQQKTNIHSQMDICADQANININRWNRQIWKGIKNSKMATFLLLWILLFGLPAYAADNGLEIYDCLLKGCREELARCIANPACAANVACIEICNNRPDETECQMRCGDLFQNSAVENFNQCALSRKKCVPQQKGEGTSPVPDPSALVKTFNIADFSGRWYISGGLNPLFDTYDCQVHEFHLTSKNLVGKLSWRISTPGGGFFTRHDIQRFVQDSSQPGILYNHDNEYLHYQDDWYILSSNIKNKSDDYIFIYYRGKNDAWEGYEGAIVYTRTPNFPSSIISKLKEAVGRVGLDFKKFKRTNNTCGHELPLLARLEKKVKEGTQAIAKEVEQLETGAEKVRRIENILFQILGK